MIVARVALGILALAVTISACSNDQPEDNVQSLVYVETPLAGGAGGRIVRVTPDGNERAVLWETRPGRTSPLVASLYPSPVGNVILMLDNDLPAWYALPATGGSATPFSKPLNAGSPHWSPDATLIAWLTGDEVTRIGLAPPGGTLLSVLTPDTLIAQQFDWSPDGTQIAFEGRQDAVGEDHIFVISRAGGPVTAVATGAENHDVTPAWSPSGEWIAFLRGTTGNGGSIWMARPNGADARSVSAGDFDRYSGLSWSPDGTRLLAYLNGAGVTMIEVATGAQTPVHPSAVSATPFSWSPDGSLVTFVGRSAPDQDENTGPTVVVSTPTGTNPLQLNPDNAYGYGPQWLPSAP